MSSEPVSRPTSFQACVAAAQARAAVGDYLEATRLLDEALRLCPPEHEADRAVALALLAHNHPRLGNLQASVRCASEAVAICERQADDTVLADALTSLSFVYAQLLMGRDALDCGLRALAAARRAADPVREGWALNRIGVAYSSLDNPAQACETTQQALEIVHKHAAPELRFSCLNNLSYFWLYRVSDARRALADGSLLEAQTQALQLAQQATAVARESGSPFQVAVAISNLIDAQLQSDAFEAALPLLAEFERLSDANGYLALGLQAVAQRALILKTQGDFAGAVARLRKLLEGQQGELPPKLRRILIRALYETHKAAGDYREALAYLEQHADLERLISRDTMALQTEVMLIRQEVDQAHARAEFALLDAQRERERASHLEREQQRLREHAAALDRAAHEDVLTGLHNRRHTEFALPLLVEGSRQAGKLISLAMLDVDHFKRVNDEFGHGVGDLVLQQLAQLLRQKMRSADLLARVGGEEFLVALVGTELPLAEEICERLRVAVADYDWSRLAPGLSVHVSIGLAGGAPPAEARLLLERADQALYAAKRAGRNRVRTDLLS